MVEKSKPYGTQGPVSQLLADIDFKNYKPNHIT